MGALAAEISRDGKRIYVVGLDGTVAAVDNDDVAEGQGEKYARLFCAAPDLLAALVDLVEQGPCLHSAHDAACGVCCARAAIAKAVKP